MKHWLLSLEPTIDNFHHVLAGHSFDYIYEGSVIALPYNEISIGDEIFGYMKAPTSEINYKFVVTQVSESTLRLQKEWEFIGISKADVVQAVPALEMNLAEFAEDLMTELTKEEFNQIWQLISTKLPSGVFTPQPVQSNSPATPVPYAHNRIIFGAPGTGKSFMLEEQRETYFVNRYRRVTFYPNYSYGQFFGTYKPTKEMLPSGDSKITYEFVPGPFMHTLLDALESKQNGTDENHLLIVEEINRANAPAVFGDVFQLLDRDAHGQSEYPITLSEDAANYIAEKRPTITIVNNEIRLPNNMYIWSTMNSADQGVQPLDSAFKRRFDFEYISINQGEDEIQYIEVKIPGVATKVKWNLFRRALNEFLVREYTHLKEDKLIGPFFIKKNVLTDEDAFESAFTNKLLMYLFEDVLKTANKDKLFTKRTFSEVVDVSHQANVTDRKVFTDLFYASLLEKVATENNEQSAQQASTDLNENQTVVEHFED